MRCFGLCFREPECPVHDSVLPALLVEEPVPLKPQRGVKTRQILKPAVNSLLLVAANGWRDRVNALASEQHFAVTSVFLYTSDYAHAVAVHSFGPAAHRVPAGLVDMVSKGCSHDMLLAAKKPLMHVPAAPIEPLPHDWKSLLPYTNTESFLLLPLRGGDSCYGGVLICPPAAASSQTGMIEPEVYDMNELEQLSQYLSVGLLSSPDLRVMQLVANAASAIQRSGTIQETVARLAETVQACLRESTRLELECLPAVAFRSCNLAAFFRSQPVPAGTQDSCQASHLGASTQTGIPSRPQSRSLLHARAAPDETPPGLQAVGSGSLAASVASLQTGQPDAGPSLADREVADPLHAGGHQPQHAQHVALQQQRRAISPAQCGRTGRLAGGGGTHVALPGSQVASLQAHQLQRDNPDSPRTGPVSLPLPAPIGGGHRVRATTAPLPQTLLGHHLDLAMAVAPTGVASVSQVYSGTLNVGPCGGGGAGGYNNGDSATGSRIHLGGGGRAAVTASQAPLPRSPEAVAALISGVGGNGSCGSAAGGGEDSLAAGMSVAILPNCAAFLLGDERQPYKDVLHVQRMLPHARAHSLVMLVSGPVDRAKYCTSSLVQHHQHSHQPHEQLMMLSQQSEMAGLGVGNAGQRRPSASLGLAMTNPSSKHSHATARDEPDPGQPQRHQAAHPDAPDPEAEAPQGSVLAPLRTLRAVTGLKPGQLLVGEESYILHRSSDCDKANGGGLVAGGSTYSIHGGGGLPSGVNGGFGGGGGAGGGGVASAASAGGLSTPLQHRGLLEVVALQQGAPSSGSGAGGSVALAAAAAATNQAWLSLYVVASESVPRVILDQVAEETRLLMQILHRPIVTALYGSRLLAEWVRFTALVLSRAHGGGCFNNGSSCSGRALANAVGALDASSPAAAVVNAAAGTALNPSSFLMHSVQTHLSGDMEELTSVSVALENPTNPNTGTLSMMISSMRDMLSTVQLERSPDFRSPSLEDIYAVRLLRVIGRGGQGMVFQGHMYNTVVAVKIIPSPGDADPAAAADDPAAPACGAANGGASAGGGGEGGARLAGEAPQKLLQRQKRWLVRDALEVAVTSTISHPHIVQVLNFFTDAMVVEYSNEAGRYRLMPREDSPNAKGSTNTAIVMEYCDAGTLKHAVDQDCFRIARGCATSSNPPAADSAPVSPAPAGLSSISNPAGSSAGATPGSTPSTFSGGGNGSSLNLVALLTSLLEVAAGLRHLHENRLVHCDVKPSNVLLRSCGADVRGWVCKLSDFGCVRLLNEVDPTTGRPAFHSLSPVGSLSYMSPESMFRDTLLDASVDIYSFGIMMWECAMGQLPYSGVPAQQLPNLVRRGLRPSFSLMAVPHDYRQVATLCWAQDPRRRPTAAALVQLLQRMLSAAFEDTLRDPAPPPAAATAAAAPAPAQPAPLSANAAHLPSNLAPRAQPPLQQLQQSQAAADAAAFVPSPAASGRGVLPCPRPHSHSPAAHLVMHKPHPAVSLLQQVHQRDQQQQLLPVLLQQQQQ